MKKYKFALLLISIIFILASFFNVRSMQESYEKEASRRLNSLVATIKDSHPDVDIEKLLQASEQGKAIDLSRYGIYHEYDFLDLSKINMETSRSFSYLFIAIILAYLLIFFFIFREQKKDVLGIIDDLEKINKGIYDIKINNQDEELARLQNEMFKTSVKLREEANNAIQVKSQLKESLEDISHQIKTPISSMYLILESLESPDISEEDKIDLLPYLKVEVDAITSLVMNLLNIASLESKTREYKRERINFKSLLEEVLDVLEPIRLDKKIEIESDLDDIFYLGDPKWEKELYINLIKNAIEHSTSDLILVRSKQTPGYLEISIENQAKPLSFEAKNKMFDRYYKLTDNDHNFGIGLNLCKMIAEANNAKISVEMDGNLVEFKVKYMKMETF